MKNTMKLVGKESFYEMYSKVLKFGIINSLSAKNLDKIKAILDIEWKGLNVKKDSIVTAAKISNKKVMNTDVAFLQKMKRKFTKELGAAGLLHIDYYPKDEKMDIFYKEPNSVAALNKIAETLDVDNKSESVENYNLLNTLIKFMIVNLTLYYIKNSEIKGEVK